MTHQEALQAINDLIDLASKLISVQSDTQLDTVRRAQAAVGVLSFNRDGEYKKVINSLPINIRSVK